MDSAKAGAYIGHGSGTGFGRTVPNDPFSTPLAGLQHAANGQGMNSGDWGNLLGAAGQQQHPTSLTGDRHWASSSSGWPASQAGLATGAGACGNGAPSGLPSRLGTPDRHMPNPPALGRAQTGPPAGFGGPISAGDFSRVGSGFNMPPQRPGSAQLQQPMLNAGQQQWSSSGGKQTPNGFPGQRIPPVNTGGLGQGGRLFTDANASVGQVPMGLNGLARGRPQVSGPYPTGLGASYPGSNSGRPGSAGSVHSTASYGARVPPPSLNGVGNGVGNLGGGGIPSVSRPGTVGAADFEVLQQLHGLTLNGGAGAGVPSARPTGRVGGAPFSLPQPQQSRGDVLAALLAQARQQQQLAGLTGKAALAQQQQQQAALAQQQALIAARQQAARTNDALLARGLNGNVGANVNLQLQLAAAQQAAAARAATAHRAQQQPAAFAGAGYNGLNGLTGATGLSLPGAGPNHAAIIAEASRVAAARQQQQQAAAISGLVNGLGAAVNYYQPAVNMPTRPRAPPAPRPTGRPGGFPGVDSATLAQDTNARVVLMELGQTLAQLGITVEGAVNAGLLGGLSAADVKVLSDAHATESRRLALNVHMERMAGPTQQQQVHNQQQSQLQQQAAQQAQQQLVSQPPPPPPVQSLGTNLGQLLLPVQQQQQPTNEGVQQQPEASRPQALFPQTFQLGSSLTDTPRPSAPGSVEGNAGHFSMSSAASLSNSPFSFFGSHAIGHLPPADSIAAQQGVGLNGEQDDGDADLPLKVLNSVAELLGESPVQAADSAVPDVLPGAPLSSDAPHNTTTDGAANNYAHASFDASAYAFFGSVEASEEDALPLENDDADDTAVAVDAEDESEPSTAALSAADEPCPAPTRPNAMLDNARIVASA